MSLFDKFFDFRWRPGRSDYCCIRCGKQHQHQFTKKEGTMVFYTLDYCSQGCMDASVQEPMWKKLPWKEEHLRNSEWQQRWSALVKIGFTPENETTPKTRK